jgi:arylformamidase
MVRALYDISVPLKPTIHTYPGDRGFQRRESKSLGKGDGLTLSELHMGSHSGTHVDAPSHFIPGGMTVDQLPLETFVGSARVVELRQAVGAVGADQLEGHAGRGEILLVKTSNSGRWRRQPHFFEDYVHLSIGAAEALVAEGVKAVGIDYLSVEGFRSEGAPVHRTLLGASVGIIEGLDLFDVPPGEYHLYCLPLKVVGGEGAPARAVLLRP